MYSHLPKSIFFFGLPIRIRSGDEMIYFIRCLGAAGGGLVLFALCGTLALVGNSDRWNAFADKGQAVTIELVKRVNMLGVLAQLSGARDFRTTVLIQGNYLAKLNKEEELEQWQQNIGTIIEWKRNYEQGKETYRSSYKAHSIKVDILWFQENANRTYYTISIQGSAKGGMVQASTEGERIMTKLNKHHGPKWAATVQAVSNDSLQTNFAKAEQSLKEWGKIKLVDRYEDERTLSATYQTDYLGQGVPMKQGNVNFQLAIHENKDKGETRISFGTPLIAGEY